MGDAADDAWDAMFEHDFDIQTAVNAMKGRCHNQPCRAKYATWNDEGLLECPCGEMSDI